MRIKKAVLLEIVEGCPAVPPEVGGILGSRDGVICEYFLDKGKTCMERAVYIPQTDCLNTCIAAWDRRGIHFCGMFHSHLPWEKKLSGADEAYIRKVMLAMPDTITHLYFPLVLPHVEMLSFVAVREGGTIHIKTNDIEIID